MKTTYFSAALVVAMVGSAACAGSPDDSDTTQVDAQALSPPPSLTILVEPSDNGSALLTALNAAKKSVP